MRTMLGKLIGVAAGLLTASAALADPSNINPAKRFCWGENIGYLNWRDAGSPPGSQGAIIGAQRLSGFVWGENVGWINLGDPTTSASNHYPNTYGADCGDNNVASANRFGLAWVENIG